MPIKKEYIVFSTEGYKQHKTFKDKKGTRYVSLHVRDAQSNVYLELTVEQAKEAIQDIKKAIKESKKNRPF
jgi:hypothetical protein